MSALTFQICFHICLQTLLTDYSGKYTSRVEIAVKKAAVCLKIDINQTINIEMVCLFNFLFRIS